MRTKADHEIVQDTAQKATRETCNGGQQYESKKYRQ